MFLWMFLSLVTVLHSDKMLILVFCVRQKGYNPHLISSICCVVLYLHMPLSRQSNSGSWGDQCHSKDRILGM